MKTRKANKKVICAISGGIDSGVAAALLKKKGFDVIGVFMKFWSEPEKNGVVCVENRCCTSESEKRARQLAAGLKIPFYVFNAEKEFKKRVVDYFLKSYKIGLTPNPCVVCNKEIKFTLLFKKLLSLDADFIATGHYACLREKNKIYHLLKGKDKDKDQSYFLWRLDQKILKRTLFPVGKYTKTEIRGLAKKFKLPLLDIPESQEVCFIQTTIGDFLRKHLKTKPGKITDSQGRLIGEHQGLWFYTIGQRRGIKLSGGPFYVLDKDTEKNLLIVTSKERDLYKKELTAESINWVSGKKPNFPLRVKAKIRYKHRAAPAELVEEKEGKIKALFSQAQRAITPGQSAVFYQREELLGGGIIDK